VFLGTPEFAVPSLEAVDRLCDRGLLELTAVVTQPDRAGDRGRLNVPAVKTRALALGVPVLQPARIDEAALREILALHPELLVWAAYGNRIPGALLAAVRGRAVNVHASLLPRWRGAAPVQRALLAGDAETGVCVQRVVARLDAGPALASARTPIGGRDTTRSLRARLTELGAPLLVDVVARLARGDTLPEIPQDDALAVAAPKILRDEGALDFANEDANALDRRVRALGEAPGCRAGLHAGDATATTVLVREALPDDRSGEPGRVLDASPEGIVVAARAGALRITRLSREGGRELDARAFLNGFRVRAGDFVSRSS
jgi:methionyl-tRNA formyltransferase